MTPQPRLIGLSGRSHSGKDAACAALVKIATPKTVERVAFADKLKMSACAALGIEYQDAADAVAICNDIKEHGRLTVRLKGGTGSAVISQFIGREYLQWYGTEAHRDIFGQNFWVDALLPFADVGEHYGLAWHLNNLFPGADVIVVTDVRFPNEAERIISLGGEVWYIDAETRLGPLPDDAHVSEQPLSDKYLTATVDNNGTLEQFALNLKEAYYG
jgi:hypothetical protein